MKSQCREHMLPLASPFFVIVSGDVVVEPQGLPMETYLMAFTYGSVVMFNASEGMQKRLLRMCRKYAKNMASEDYSEGGIAVE